MSSMSIDQVKEQEVGENKLEEVEDCGENGENPMLSPQLQEEMIKKKYGGLLPKKKPLISKDHEHAFFDSADWALGKQGTEKPKGPAEALRPKLQPTPQQQPRSRRSAYAAADECHFDGGIDDGCCEDGKGMVLPAAAHDNNTASATQNQT